jgi:hypothetical protein
MVTQYDEKGKIFTQVVSKEPITVVIQTAQNFIHGAVHVRPDMRMKDEVNDLRERFMAVTDAIIFDSQKVELYRSNFLLLNIDQIIWIIPNEDLA